MFRLRRGADDRERAALAQAQGSEFGDALLRQAEHVAFLRFVAPQLQRRQRRVVAGDLVEVDHAADAGIVQQFGDRIGQAAGADVVDRCDRIGVGQRDATVDHFLAAPLHLRVVALH